MRIPGMAHKTISCLACVVLVAILALNPTPAIAKERTAVMPQTHAVTLFKTHCYSCHDADSEEAGVNLEDISYEASSDLENAALWQKILNAINSGEMPPRDAELYGRLHLRPERAAVDP